MRLYSLRERTTRMRNFACRTSLAIGLRFDALEFPDEFPVICFLLRLFVLDEIHLEASIIFEIQHSFLDVVELFEASVLIEIRLCDIFHFSILAN